MNIVCLNCEEVTETEDPRKKFCGKVCRNRWNVRKTRSKPKKEVMGLDKLREVIKKIEEKKEPKVTRSPVSRETYQKDEWIDPI